MQQVVEKYPNSRLSEMAGMILNGVKAGIQLKGGTFDLRDVYKRQESRHHFIEQDEVEGLLAAKFNGIRAVAYRLHLVSFLFQKDRCV